MFGVLSLRNYEGQVFNIHGLCGPWGCTAPPEALLAYHGFWLVLLIPIFGLLFSYLPLSPAKVLARFLFWGGLSVTLIFFIWVSADWALNAYVHVRKHALRHGLIRVLGFVDAPMMQSAVIGLIGFVIVRWRNRPQVDAVHLDALATN